MKILKWIVIILVAIIGVFLIYSATQPNKIDVERSIVIDATADVVFAEITDFPAWGEWSAWNKKDPEMKNEYMGEPGTVGYVVSWKSDHQEVGNGKQEIVELEENKLMKTKMNFEGWDADNYATFMLEENEGKTTLTWNMDGAETPFYFNFMNAMMIPAIEKSYEESLADLKEVIESKPVVEVENPMNLEVKEVEAINIISIKDSTDAAGIGAKLTELYTELSIFMETKGLKEAGMPIGIYYSYSEEKVVMEAALPYSGEAVAEGRVTVKQTPAGKAIFGAHFGSYESSGNMHMAIEKYMQANNYEFHEMCWEVYANDPTTVDSAAVETHIYYPIKDKEMDEAS